MIFIGVFRTNYFAAYNEVLDFSEIVSDQIFVSSLLKIVSVKSCDFLSPFYISDAAATFLDSIAGICNAFS